VAPERWEQASERSQQGTIRRTQHRTSLLPAEHDQLVPQDEQFDVVGELTAPALTNIRSTAEKARKANERSIRRSSHSPAQSPSSRVRRQSVAQPSPDLVFARARETK
jgi:hypothetical protein